MPTKHRMKPSVADERCEGSSFLDSMHTQADILVMHGLIRHRADRHKGFTLIEAMVVIVIVAIIVGIGLPGLKAFIAGNRLVTQTNDVLSALQIARSEATRLNAPVTFCRVASSTATTCQGGGGGEDWRFWAVLAPSLTQPVLRRGEISSSNINLRVNSNLASRVGGTATENAITFEADSLARMTDGRTLMTGSIRICSTDSSLSSNFRSIRLVGGGRVYVDAALSNGITTCTNTVS